MSLRCSEQSEKSVALFLRELYSDRMNMPMPVTQRVRWRKAAMALLAGMCLCPSIVFAQKKIQLSIPMAAGFSGVVQSQGGTPIPGARIEIGAMPYAVTLFSNDHGRFSLDSLSAGEYSLTTSAEGFETDFRSIAVPPGRTSSVSITLKILPVQQTIVVSSTDTPERLKNIPAQITVLNSKQLDQSAALTLDDFLREIPGFSLYRRTSSMVSQPTTNGVSLRGIGASGVSRTLVFLDGIPINDPVGSWVYWDQAPESSIRTIEVAPGGISSLYGSSAMAGVIDISTRQPATPALDVSGLTGSNGTADLDYLAGSEHGRFSYDSAGSLFRTNGYTLVPEPYRGSVDIPAGSQHETASARVAFQATRSTSLFLSGRFLNELHGNGTPLQNNSTRQGTLHAGLRSHANSGTEWRANVFSFDQTFHSSFSSVAVNRNSETLALLQTEPAYGWGANVQWSRPLSGHHLLSAGGDARWTYARDEENAFSPARANTVNRRIPGEQALAGAFFQDYWAPSQRLDLIAGARVDTRKNYGASLAQFFPASGVQGTTKFPAVSKSVITPHAGAVLHLTRSLAAHASFYQGFRAPTLDELYRSFRVGNILTEANPNLTSERLTGYEVGISQQVSRQFFWRVTAYDDQLNDPVSNVALSVTPSLITQQRENLGRVDVKGLGADASYSISERFRVDARYLFSQSTIASFSADPALVGNLLPQVPKNSASIVLSGFGPWHFDSMLEARYESHRFDDDLNTLELGSFFVLDAKVSRDFGGRWTPFLEVENLLNRQYAVEATPVREIGTPFLVFGGVRFQFHRQNPR